MSALAEDRSQHEAAVRRLVRNPADPAAVDALKAETQAILAGRRIRPALPPDSPTNEAQR